MTPEDILAQVVSKDTAGAFVEYRKGMGKRFALTERAAKSIAKSLEQIRAEGGDPDGALDLAQEHGWMTVKPDWYWRQNPRPGLKVINGGQHEQDTTANATLDLISYAARSR